MAALAQAIRAWLAPIADPRAYLEPLLETQPDRAPHAEALLRQLQLRLRHRLQQAPPGDQRSLLRGQGLDFAELREYVPGDDIRKIDWNVFARTLSPHIKEFHEEKQLTAWLYVDLSPSMFFGQHKTKAEQAIELAGLLGLLLQDHRLGAMLAHANGTEIIEPRQGQAHLQRLLQRLLDLQAQEQSRVQAVPSGFQGQQFGKLEHLVGKGASVFFLSDHQSPTEDWQRPLGELSRRARLVHLILQDPAEQSLPPASWTLFDPESEATVNPGLPDAAAYAHAFAAQQERLQRQLSQTGTAVLASTAEEPLDTLVALFRQGRG